MTMDEMRQDLKYAIRAMGKAPGHSGLVILTLAFGIAANTTIFSVMNPYLFRSLPYEEAEDLVQINQVDPVTGWDMARFSYPQYVDWRERSRALQDVAAYTYGSTNVTGNEAPEQVQSTAVTANMFDVLGAQPVMGRTFRPEDGQPGAEPVVLLDHGLWQRRYAADPALLGRPITLDGRPHTVIGIMSPHFVFPFGGVKLWTPVQEATTADRARLSYQLIGRLAEGWTAERAHAELAGIQSDLSELHPDVDGRMDGVTVKPVREALNFAWDVLNALFFVLLGAVGFVLLIACANVASLTLARAGSRLPEVSVRAALGASRRRIVRQLFTESTVLAVLGGILGVTLAYFLTGLLDPMIPEDLFKVGAVSIDARVLAFSAVVTLATPVAFGLFPALNASRMDLVTGLKEGAKGSGGVGTSRGRQGLVVAQVALAVVLVAGAGLMLRSFASVQSLDLGFAADRVATVEIFTTLEAHPTIEERRLLMQEAVERARRIPGVEAASAVAWLPLNHETIQWRAVPAAMAGAPPEEWPLATINRVLPGYFEAMSIGVRAGRDVSTLDGPDAQPVVLVNRRMANQHWPDGNPVGQTILMGDPESPSSHTVIGVVDDVYHADLDPDEIGAQVYQPLLQTSVRRFFLVARTPGDPAALIPGLRSALSEMAPDIPLTLRPMTEVVSENQLQWSISSLFLGIFGGGALLLATLGIYGLVSYSVAQREREMAVRVALGASGGEIRKRVVGEGLKLTSAGLVVGLLASLGAGRVLSSVLYGVGGADPTTLGSVMGLFLAVAAVASFVPAARASRTSPITVLRSE